MADAEFPNSFSGLATKGETDGSLTIKLVDRGSVIGGIQCPARDAGPTTALMLGAALQAAQGREIETRLPPDFPLHVISVSEIWLEGYPKPNTSTLHVRCGEAHFGIEMPHDVAAQLAQALLEASGRQDTIQ